MLIGFTPKPLCLYFFLRRLYKHTLTSSTYKRALGQWGFCPAGFFIFDFLFLSGVWVKAKPCGHAQRGLDTDSA